MESVERPSVAEAAKAPCFGTREPAGQHVGRELERGRPLAERADASMATGRAQRGTVREREGAFGNAAITVEVRYSP